MRFKFTNLSFLFVFFYLLSQSNLILSSTTNNIDRKQARNYIGHVIDTLFIPTNHSGKYERELRNFIDDITYILLRRLGHYPSSFSFSKIYKANELYDAVVQESINFVKDTSLAYAKEYMRTAYVSPRINKQDIISKVTTNFYNEIRYLVDKSTDLPPGIFTNYYGAPLADKISSLIKEEIRKVTISLPKPTYPTISNPTPSSVYSTEECPICFEKFDRISSFGLQVKRLFLRCGHNICVECLRAWVKEKGASVTCPMCRGNINVSDFANELWPPSAPSY